MPKWEKQISARHAPDDRRVFVMVGWSKQQTRKEYEEHPMRGPQVTVDYFLRGDDERLYRI
jgi:hypothetical protein